MDLEELKLVLDTVSGLGDSAYWAAVLIIGKGYLETILSNSLWLFGLIGVYRIAKRCLGELTLHMRICAALNTEFPLASYEVKNVVNLVKKHLG